MADWFYSRDGQQQGPIPEPTFKQWVQAGNIGGSDLVWQEGMPNWLPVGQVPELAALMPGLGMQSGYPQAGYSQPGYPQAGYGAQPTGLEYGLGQSHYTGPRGRPQGMEIANFGWRLLAWAIDYVVTLSVGVVMLLAAGIGLEEFAQGQGRGESVQSLVQFGHFLVIWIYHAAMNSSSLQGTLGKMACGMKVTDMRGQRITFGRATGRYFASILSGCLCLAGYIMQAFNAEGQTLHDNIAGTLVYKKQ